jgi:phosphatidylserine/phosphatidylglycerophosphate/cardiolipin synthase-like enzyme
MSAPLRVGAIGPSVGQVTDDAYLPVLRGLIAASVHHCLASIFIVDLAPARDEPLVVDDVLQALRAAAWRGVDVRLLVGGSRDNFEIAQMADAARVRALELGLECRWLTSTNVRGSHSKVVVADDAVLLGSHNWSPGAFGGQTQDSVLIASPDIAVYLRASFERRWADAQGGR